MPWLTPDEIPEGDDCRPLLIPASGAWLALVSGALTELTKPYNWQKFGTLTIQETVDKMQDIVDYYYNAPCATCVTPGDYRVTRISSTGHLQQLNSEGEWEDATGDYEIPAPTARTEGTAPDQNCLAAKNATNVLETLYENISASYASELSTDEAITAFIAAVVAAVGFEFAPVTWSIAAGGFVFFEALFKALEYITADLWTDDFSSQFTCLLLNCASNTAGVVTFDWDCVNAGLLAQVNTMGLSEVQMRLYVQVGFMLHFIGGVDGLNLAARTTDITNDDCSACDEPFCYEIDTTASSELWNAHTGSGNTYAQWVSGEGWIPDYDVYTVIYTTPIAAPVYLDSLRIWTTAPLGRLRLNMPGGNSEDGSDFTTGVITDPAYTMDGALYMYLISIGVASTGMDFFSDKTGGGQRIVKSQIRGTGILPSGWLNNCV